MVARQDDEPDPELTEGFGGEVTSVTPDDAPSSRWDQHAEDEDALIADESPER
jgi:hypothetical protein